MNFIYYMIQYGSYYMAHIIWTILYGWYNLYYIIWLFDVIFATLCFKVDDVDTVSEHLPPQTTKRSSIFHQPGSEWNRGKRVSISYTTQQADMDSPHRPRKVWICISWPWNRTSMIWPIWYCYYLTGDIVTIWI